MSSSTSIKRIIYVDSNGFPVSPSMYRAAARLPRAVKEMIDENFLLRSTPLSFSINPGESNKGVFVNAGNYNNITLSDAVAYPCDRSVIVRDQGSGISLPLKIRAGQYQSSNEVFFRVTLPAETVILEYVSPTCPTRTPIQVSFS